MGNLDTPATLLAVATGIGLAAAVGFRVFLPLLLAGLAARLGFVDLAEGFAWLASDPALFVLGVAAVAEVGAYFFPFLDHLLDVIGGPVAMLAGALLMASVLVDLPAWLRGVLAVVVGGGTAGLVHGANAGLRGASTASTAGLANPAFAGLEATGAVVLVVLAVLLPLAAVALVVVLLVRGARGLRRLFLVLLLVLAAAAPQAAHAAEGTTLVPFRIKDQHERLHTSGSCRHKVAVVAWGDRNGSDILKLVAPALRDSLAGLERSFRLKVLPVGHFQGLPFFLKGMIRGRLQEEWSPTLMDFDGLFKETYGLPEDRCAVLVFDPQGALQARFAFAEFAPDSLAGVLAVSRRLASMR